jgi:ADP-ribose pyrophosphatase YjhB (NUDIX family)
MAFHHKMIGFAAQLYWRTVKARTLGVRSLVLDGDERVALVRHTYIDGWHLPGGGVKKGESFEAGLARELREEVGLQAFTIDRVLGVYHNMREGKDDHVAVFVTRVPAGTPVMSADRMEIAEAAWFSLKLLPMGLSSATARRISEYREGTTGTGDW